MCGSKAVFITQKVKCPWHKWTSICAKLSTNGFWEGKDFCHTSGFLVKLLLLSLKNLLIKSSTKSRTLYVNLLRLLVKTRGFTPAIV